MRTKKACRHKNNVVYYNDLITEYDFHFRKAPVYNEEIYKEIDNIVEYERKNKNSIFRIIVGKGNNSAFGPVIKPMIEFELLNLARSNKIKKFNLEKMRNGKINSGAFIVEIY